MIRGINQVNKETLGQLRTYHNAPKLEREEPQMSIEQEIQDKGLTAPRITPQELQDNISSAHYFTARDGVVGVDLDEASGTQTPESLSLLTICVLVLKNGFTVTGESACASPENFDAEIGQKIARQNAESKIWPLMGYHLKENLNK